MGRAHGLLLLTLAGCWTFNPGDDDDDPTTRPDANVIDACVKRTCTAAGATCGSIDDGCGGTVECGTCGGLATCGGQGVDNVCAIPAADRVCADGWCWEAPAPFPFVPASVFALSTTDVWTVGARGTVLHYDGTHWRSVAAGTTADLNDVWMASASDGWLVGAGGVIRRWNGSAWNAVTSGTTADLRGVWGTAANNVWIVGENIGKRWTGSALVNGAVTTPSLEDVFVAGTKVFAVGEGYVWELVTATWTKRTSDSPSLTSYRLTSIGGTATDVYALGRKFSFATGEDLGFHWTGTTWEPFTDPGDPEWAAVYADGANVFGASDQSIASLPSLVRVQGPGGAMLAVAGTGGQTFVAGLPRNGDQLHSGSGGTWSPAASFGSRLQLTDIALVGDSVWYGGPNATVTEWRGGPIEHALPTGDSAVAIAGSARDNVWVATDWDTYHFDGQTWTDANAPAFADPLAIVMIGDEPVLVGEEVHRYTGGAWVEQEVGTGVTYAAGDEHGGELYIAGATTTSPSEAYVTRTVGGTWMELPKPAAMEHACGIAVATPDDIWIAGYNGGTSGTVADGVVAHWNGNAWTVETRAAAGRLCAIELHGGEVWTSGAGTVLHRRAANGTWSTSAPVRAGSIRALRSHGTTLWAVGDYGAVLRRE